MRRRGWVALGALAVLGVGGCNRSSTSGGGGFSLFSGSKVQVQGAGLTSIAPLMAKWVSEYQSRHPQVQITYSAFGSGPGLEKLLAHQVHFSTIDGALTDAQLKEAKGPMVHVPVAMTAVVPVYNLPRLPHAFRFTPESLAGIFLGKIKVWNDPKLVADNPLLELPPTPIVVLHRSEGSGSTLLVTDYLSRVSPDWKKAVGAGLMVTWPVGTAVRGNEGVGQAVLQTEGAVGLVDLGYALQTQLPVGELKNRAGNFIEPTTEAVSEADFGDAVPDDLRFSFIDAPGEKAWPISGAIWAVAYQDVASTPEGAAAVDFLRWVAHDGRRFCTPLNFSVVPKELQGRIDARLSLLQPR